MSEHELQAAYDDATHRLIAAGTVLANSVRDGDDWGRPFLLDLWYKGVREREDAWHQLNEYRLTKVTAS